MKRAMKSLSKALSKIPKNAVRVGTSTVALGLVILGFQNCSGKFSAVTAVTTGNVIQGSNVCLSDLAANGKTVYATNCASCHGQYANTDKSGRTVIDITQALATQPAMQSISLSSNDIQSLAAALGMNSQTAAACAGSATPTPTPAPGATANPTPVATATPASTNTSCTDANVSAGKTLYATNCTSCHTAIATSAKIGTTFSAIKGAISSVPAMSSIKLSDTDLQNIAAALDAGTATVPSCGSGVVATGTPSTLGNSAASSANFFACNPGDDPGVRDTRRLSKAEYLATLKVLLGSYFDIGSISLQTDLLPADAITTASPIFDTTDNTISANHVSAYIAVGTSIAGSLASNSQFLADKIQCTSSTGMTDACWTRFFNGFAAQVFRRPLTSTEQSDYKALFADPALSGDFNDGLLVVLASMFNSPNFILKPEVAGGSIGGRSDLLSLSDYETATRLSFWVTGHGPDSQLMLDASSGALKTPAGYKSVVNRLFASSEAKTHLDDFYNQWLAVLNMPNPGQTSSFIGSVPVATVRSEAAQEVQDFTNYFTWTAAGTFKDLMTSTKNFVRGPALASIYGVAQSGSSAGGQTIQAQSMTASTGKADGTSGWNLYSNGTLAQNVSLNSGTSYTVNVMAKADLAANLGAAMTVTYGSQSVGSATVSSTSYQSFSFTFTPAAASGSLSIAFTNDVFDQSTGQDRNLYVQSVSLTANTSQAPAGADLPVAERSGLLTRVAMLVGSTDHTGLVHRGLIGRRNILCDPITPPVIPPGQASLFSAPIPDPVLSQREQIAQRTSPTQCQACHSMLNPMGFSMENYDALGRYRTKESIFDSNGNLIASHPIDASVSPNIESTAEATTTSGVAMAGAVSSSSKGPACMVKQYFVYTQQRMWTPADSCALNAIYSQLTDTATASVSGDTPGTILNMFKSTVYESSFRVRKVGPQ